MSLFKHIYWAHGSIVKAMFAFGEELNIAACVLIKIEFGYRVHYLVSDKHRDRIGNIRTIPPWEHIFPHARIR